MAKLNVLSYNLPQIINMKSISDNNKPTGQSGITTSLSKTFNKITVQNVLSENNANSININHNNVNTIVRRIKDFGMFGSVNQPSLSSSKSSTSAASKRPLSELKSNTQQSATPPPSKKIKSQKEPSTPKTTKKAAEKLDTNTGSSTPSSKPVGTPGRKGLPLPQAVARRNARERNRVKQVNNGFAALRERIPEEVAEAFEAQGNGRGTTKKLSKVETLRMAVEYIRSLERLLGFNFPIGGMDNEHGPNCQSFSSSEESFTKIKDDFEIMSPSMDEHYEDSLSNYDVDEYFSPPMNHSTFLDQSFETGNQLDFLPSITTLNGLQYIRIPGTNTYQLLTPDIFVGNSHSPPSSSVDEEQFNALIDTNCLSPAASSATTAADSQSSPPIIATTATTIPLTAPATPSTATGNATAVTAATSKVDGECVSTTAPSSSSRSPVPQNSSPTTSSSLRDRHHAPQLQEENASPAADELLMQACATNRLRDVCSRQLIAATLLHQQQLPLRLIKQELNEADYVNSAAVSPNGARTAPLIFPTPAENQQQQFLLRHAALSMSTPLQGRASSAAPVQAKVNSAGLDAFYEQDHSSQFYEGVVSLKKELNDMLLATSPTTAGLSDESMIETIDWWDAHTPKSDGGSSVIL